MRSVVRLVFAAVVLVSAAVWTARADAATHVVAIRNFSFGPAITIDVGDTVTWMNADSVPHSVARSAGGPPNSPVINPGTSWTSPPFTVPGTYAYVCGIHGALMPGTVIVRGAVVTTAPPPPPTPRPTVAPAPSPSATPSPSPSPTETATPSPTVAAPTRTPSPTQSAAPSVLTAPAAADNTLLGAALLAMGLGLLAGTLWWRFGRR